MYVISRTAHFVILSNGIQLSYTDDASASVTLHLSYVIGIIYFAHMVPVLAITLSPQRVLLLSMNDGGVSCCSLWLHAVS